MRNCRHLGALSTLLLLTAACGPSSDEVVVRTVLKATIASAQLSLDGNIVEGARIDVHEDRIVAFDASATELVAQWPIVAHLPTTPDAIEATISCDTTGSSACIDVERSQQCAADCRCADSGLPWYVLDSVIVDVDMGQPPGAHLLIEGTPVEDTASDQAYCATDRMLTLQTP